MNHFAPGRALADHLAAVLADARWHALGESFPLRIQIAGQPESQVSAVCHEREGEQLIFVDFTTTGNPPDSAETGDSLFGRYLDLNLRERVTLWSLTQSRHAGFILCLTPEGCSLLDSVDELALARCSNEKEEAGLAVLERALAEAVPAHRARADATRVSEDLIHWSDLFAGSMGPALKWARPDARRLGRQLLLGLKSLLAARGADLQRNLVRLGLTITEGNGLEIVYDAPPPPEFAEVLLAEAASLAPQGAGAFASLERAALVRQLRELPPSRQSLLSEVTRLASAKLRASIQLATLAPLEQEPASWRMALLEPLRAQDEIESADFYVFQPLELDLSQCGFGRVLEAIEKLALHALKQNGQIRQAGGRQIDMIEPEPEGLDEHQTMADPFNWVFRQALRLRVGPPWREAVAYLAASHVLDLRSREEFAACRPTPLTSLPYLFA